MLLKVVAAIAVLLCVVATSACVTTRNEQATTAASSVPTGQNTPASQTTVSVSVTNLGEASAITSIYGGIQTTPLPGNKFVKFAMYFQNINAPGTMIGNPTEVTLRDKQGNLYQNDLSGYTAQEQVGGQTLKGLTVQTNTQPGDKYSGVIVFQIPQSAQPKSLTYDDYTNRITISL